MAKPFPENAKAMFGDMNAQKEACEQFFVG